MREQIDVAVIGAGQCGLAVGRQLARRGHDFILIDRCSQIGDSWRRWMDSLRLVTPAATNGLPGLPFPREEAYPTKYVMADYLEQFAESMGLPHWLNTQVDRVGRQDRRFVLDLTEKSQGNGDPQQRTLEANNVIVAAGFLHTLQVPGFATELDPGIDQLHMATYRNPGQVEGPVLIVGAGNSGVQIAYDLAATHEVWLAGPNPGHFAFDLSAPILWQLAHRLLTPENIVGQRFITTMLRREPPVIKISERRLRQAGVTRFPKIQGQRQGFPVLTDGRTLRPSTIIWTTGFRPDFGWIDLPIIDDATNLPLHTRGTTEIDGLYFMGLPFQYGFTSHFISGIDRDAEYIVSHIERCRASATPARA